MEKTRRLPRHVDGRIMIGPFTIKGLIKFVPIALTIVFLTYKFFSAPIMFIGILALGFTGFLFVEFRNKETGLDYIKEFIKYELRPILIDFFPQLFKEKKIIVERSVDDVQIIRRFIANKKVREIRSKQKENREQVRSEI